MNFALDDADTLALLLTYAQKHNLKYTPGENFSDLVFDLLLEGELEDCMDENVYNTLCSFLKDDGEYANYQDEIERLLAIGEGKGFEEWEDETSVADAGAGTKATEQITNLENLIARYNITIEEEVATTAE